MPLPAILTGISAAVSAIPTVAEAVSGILDRWWPKQATEQEKQAIAMQMTQILQSREDELLKAQRDIIVAELTQGDKFTKRARPLIVYAGLGFIFLIHVAFPIITWLKGNIVPDLSLPEEFWWAWTGICGTWVIGRSFEKRGSEAEIIKMITGSK